MRTALSRLAAQLIQPLRPLAIIVLGVYTLVWGIWVIEPAWNAIGHGQVFKVMSSLFPEYVWGTLGILIGIVLLFGLIIKSYQVLVVGSTLSGWFWGLITLLLFFGDWHSVLGWTALVFAIHASFIYLNIKINRDIVGLKPKKP